MSDTDKTGTENQQQADAEREDIEQLVTEDRDVPECKSSGKGKTIAFLFVLVILAGGGAAGWYYQSMWLPQAKTWLAEAWPWPAQAEVDMMAAPPVDEAYLGGSASSVYVLPAIPDPEQQEGTKPTEVAQPASAEEDKQDIQVTEAEMQPGPVAQETAVENNEPVIEDKAAVVEEVVVAEEVASTDKNTEAPVVAPVEEVAQAPVASVQESPAPVVDMQQQPASVAAEASPAPKQVTLQQARQAYWSRNLVQAESMYHALLANAGTNADIWGELGNVYYMQAKWPQAAEAYAEAAIRLVQTGNVQRAMYMRYIVQGLDRSQAQRVDEQLRQIQTPAR